MKGNGDSLYLLFPCGIGKKTNQIFISYHELVLESLYLSIAMGLQCTTFNDIWVSFPKTHFKQILISQCTPNYNVHYKIWDESKTFSCGVCEEMGGGIIEVDLLTVSRWWGK